MLLAFFKRIRKHVHNDGNRCSPPKPSPSTSLELHLTRNTRTYTADHGQDRGTQGAPGGQGSPGYPFPAWPPWAPWVPLSWQWCAAKVCSLINNWPVRHSSWLILALFGSSWLLRKFHQRAIHMFESTRDIEPRFAWLLAEPRFAWLTSEESQGLPGSQSL